MLKWDKCIERSKNSMPYAYSWYLNLVCDNWDALVYNDYEAVMPLPWKSWFGLKYITNPYFCQQLGVFYTQKILDVDVFVNAIPRKFVYVSLNLNVANGHSKFAVKKNSNYELEINDIEFLRNKYSKSQVKNINKAKNKGVELSANVDSYSQYSDKKAIEAKAFMNSSMLALERQIMCALINTSKGRIYSVSFNGQNCCSVFLIVSDKRLILLSSYSDKIGKSKRAYFLLLDHIFSLPNFAGFTFDFEGSNIQSIADRNARFGATLTNYYTIRRFFWQKKRVERLRKSKT